MSNGRRTVLNVGGSTKAIPLPPAYTGPNWDHLLLDIVPGADVDIVLDARELTTLPAAQFDAVYCSHNLEHYERHEVPVVLAGFVHVLKPDGFADIRVPDVEAVIRQLTLDLTRVIDIDDTLYTSPAGPVTAHDILYGYGPALAGGLPHYAHRCGFTAASLMRRLAEAGFAWVKCERVPEAFELRALAMKKEPVRG